MHQDLDNTAMNAYKKRERTQNWSNQEKKFLLELCRKDMRIIENKRLDAGLTALKKKAWKIIHQKFSQQFGTERTSNRLKEQWRRIKACTRTEIMDYNNRLTHFGSDVADTKKPSPFAFDVWNFIHEAKTACKSEALDNIDYTKISLGLEEDFEDGKENYNKENNNGSCKPPQKLYGVNIKEIRETLKEINNELKGEPLNNSSPQIGIHHVTPNGGTTSLLSNEVTHAALNDNASILAPGGNDLKEFQSGFNINKISVTLEALNALRAGRFSSAEENKDNKVLQQQKQKQPQKLQTAQKIPTVQPLQTAQKLQSAQKCSTVQQLQTAELQTTQLQNAQQLQTAQTLPTVQKLSTVQQPEIVPRPQQPQSAPQQFYHQEQKIDSQSPPAKRPRTSSASNCDAAVSTTAELNSCENCQSKSSSSEICCDSDSSPELKAFMEMQNKEHLMRMRLLEVQLQAAKHSRDLIEINKTLALQKLQEYGNRNF